MFINCDGHGLVQGAGLKGKFDSLVLNQIWKERTRELFFDKLMKILFKSALVKESWRKDLLRAAILVGQSQCSSNVPQAFLWNMIAIEVLVSQGSGNYSKELPKRIEAFLGWSGYWKVRDYESRIKSLYQKRCGMVHSGEIKSISVDDLLFTDDLLVNLFSNIVQNTKIFDSKESIIRFTDKVAAEHLLGIKSKVRPKNLMFFSRTYSQQDLESI